MRRRLLIIAACLLAGAILNVAVAWGEAAWSNSVAGEPTSWRLIEEGPQRSYLEGPQRSYLLIEQYFGMPVRSFSRDKLIVFRPTTESRRIAASRAFHRLPLRPVWAGFLINTIVFGSGVWIVWRARSRYVQRSRIERGLCPKCAYPVGESAVCCECGRELAT